MEYGQGYIIIKKGSIKMRMFCKEISKRNFIMLFIFLSYLFHTEKCFAQANSVNFEEMVEFHRSYNGIYGIKYDLINSSENSKSALKIFSDIFYRGIGPKIKNDIVKNVTGFAWSFVGKWFSILWPHEFGHVLRTKQVGGKFSFVKLKFPGIIGDMDLPYTATLEQRTLALIGGFETNYLIARDIQFDFHKYDGLYNDEVGVAFGNRIMYALYVFVFSRQNPKDLQTWYLEGGDPVNFTKLVWELGGREVVTNDSVVNNDLIKFYNFASWISIFWNLLDVNFYKQARAFFGDELKEERPLFFGNENLSWSYGTLFNTSVLGAELYFNNYIKSRDNFYCFYIKYGFPFENYGLGFILSDMVNLRNINVTGRLDFWGQEFYKKGVALSLSFQQKISDKLSIMGRIGYKTKGYLVGQPICEGLSGYFGLNYDLYM